MRLTRRQLYRLIQESLLNEMTPDIIGTPGAGGDARAASKQAKMSNVPHELLSAVIQVIPPFGEIADAGLALYHGKKGVEKVMSGDEAGARQEFEEAGTYAAFFFVPGFIEFFLKAIKRLMKTLKGADDILEAALKEAKKSAEFKPAQNAGKLASGKYLPLNNWDLNHFKTYWSSYNKKLMDSYGIGGQAYKNRGALAFKSGKYKGWTPIAVEPASGQLMIIKQTGGKESVIAISPASAVEGINSNSILLSVYGVKKKKKPIY